MNKTLNETNEERILFIWKHTTLSVLYTQMMLSTTLNTLSILCICMARAFSPVNLFILNLAVSDILYASNIPMIARQFHDQPSTQYTLLTCRLNYLIDFIAMTANVYTVVALTFERLLLLNKKNKTNSSTSDCKIRLIGIVIFGLWLISIVFSLPKSLSIQINDSSCSSDWSEKQDKIHFILTFILFYAFPSIVLIVSSIFILIFLRNWAKTSKYLRDTSQRQIRISTQPHLQACKVSLIRKRTTKFVLAIVFSFLCTWSPLWLLHIFDQFSNQTSNQHVMHINSIVLMLNYSSGVINPILYMILTKNFRDYLEVLLSKIFICKRNTHHLHHHHHHQHIHQQQYTKVTLKHANEN